MATVSYQKNNSQQQGTGNCASSSNAENEVARISFLDFFRGDRPKVSTKSICGFALALFAIAIGAWILLFSRQTTSLSDREAQGLAGNPAARSAVAPPSSTSSTGDNNLADVAERISGQLDLAISKWENENGEFDDEIRDRLAIDLGKFERRMAPEKVDIPSTITASPIVVRPTIEKEIVATPTITAQPKMVTPTITKAQTITVTNTFTMPKVTVTPTVTTSTVVQGPITITHQCEYKPVTVHYRNIIPTFTAKPVKITPTVTKTVTVTPTVTAKAIRVTPTITQQPFVITPTSYAELVTVTPTARLPKLIVTSTEYNEDCYIDHESDYDYSDEERKYEELQKYKKEHPEEFFPWELESIE